MSDDDLSHYENAQARADELGETADHITTNPPDEKAVAVGLALNVAAGLIYAALAIADRLESIDSTLEFIKDELANR